MMPKNALIVDDSQLAQFVLKKMLKEEHITAECSGSAEEALDYLKSKKPDIIFLDHTMPGMNGLEVLKLLKADPETQAIPVMMYTSQEDQHYTEKAIALGALRVLPKQLTRPDLHQILTTLDTDTFPEIKQEEGLDNTLEQIVYDAEEALKHETWQQRFKHTFEDERDRTSEQINRLNERIERVILQQDEQPLKRQLFWNNIFWIALFCLSISVFAFIYWQQSNELERLQQQSLDNTLLDDSSNANFSIRSESINSDNINNINNRARQGVAENIPTTSNEIAHQELEDIYNTDNNIPFDEILLGRKTLSILEEMDQVLSIDGFRGIVEITPENSTFCLQTNAQAQLELPQADSLVSQCRISNGNNQITENTSVEFQQFIDSRNQNNRDYQYSINPIANNIDGFPVASDTLTAGEWNQIASNNRRIQFRLIANE